MQRVDQGANRATADQGVRVQQQNVAAACLAQRTVVGPAEAGVCRGDQHPHLRELLAEHRHAAVGGGVVDHHDLGVHAGQFGAQAGQTVPQQVTGVEVDDYD